MRAIVVVAAALLVVGAGAPLVAASGAGPPASDSTAVTTPAILDTPDNGTQNGSENASMPPGARLAGVVNVQAAEVEGEMQQRSFGLEVAAAHSNASKAAVVAAQTGELNETLAELQERKRALVQANQNDSIPQARFRAEMAGLAAEISTARRLSNATADTARALPSADLEAHGVDVTEIEHLGASASDLSGPTVSSIARDIAGVSNASGGPPFGVGGPGFGDAPGEGASDNQTVGPNGNRPVNPGGGSGAPPNTTDVTDVVNDTTVDSPPNTTDENGSLEISTPSPVQGPTVPISDGTPTNTTTVAEYATWPGSE